MTVIRSSLSCDQSFKEMVAMCLVKDQTKRPTAEKLLKHSFFKQAKPPELSVKKLFAELPPLWQRVKALQLKDAAQLALKKMPSAEQEAISQSEYKRGVSAWNFDIEDLKVQASLVQDDDEIQEMREEDESMKSFVIDKDSSDSRSSLGKSISTNDNFCRGRITGDELAQAGCLSKKGKSLRSDSLESSNQEKIGQEKDISSAEMMPSTSEKDMVNAKTKTQMVKGRQTQSGPLMPGVVLSHSLSDRGRSFERSENEIQPITEKANREVRRAPSFSGPLMLPTRASANSLSAPIKSSAGYRDSLEEKSKANLVQIKGRFSVTSENVDLVKDIPLCAVARRSSQGSPLRKSASVGDWMFDSKPMLTTPKDFSNSNVPASLLMPHLQNLFQQTSLQQDLITNLLNSLQSSEIVDASQNGKLPPLPRGAENNGNVDPGASERERLLLSKVSELQARMINLTDELTAEKFKYMQLQQQLNAVSGQEDGDKREGDA